MDGNGKVRGNFEDGVESFEELIKDYCDECQCFSSAMAEERLRRKKTKEGREIWVTEETNKDASFLFYLFIFYYFIGKQVNKKKVIPDLV